MDLVGVHGMMFRDGIHRPVGVVRIELWLLWVKELSSCSPSPGVFSMNPGVERSSLCWSSIITAPPSSTRPATQASPVKL